MKNRRQGPKWGQGGGWAAAVTARRACCRSSLPVSCLQNRWQHKGRRISRLESMTGTPCKYRGAPCSWIRPSRTPSGLFASIVLLAVIIFCSRWGRICDFERPLHCCCVGRRTMFIADRAQPCNQLAVFSV